MHLQVVVSNKPYTLTCKPGNAGHYFYSRRVVNQPMHRKLVPKVAYPL